MLWPSSLSEFDDSEDEVTAVGDGEGLSVWPSSFSEFDVSEDEGNGEGEGEDSLVSEQLYWRMLICVYKMYKEKSK